MPAVSIYSGGVWWCWNACFIVSGCLTCQVPLCHAGASDTARRQRQQAPLDADAAGLLALLLVAQPAQESHALQQSQSQQYEQEQEQEQRQEQQREQQPVGAGLSPAAAAEAADCCCQLLAVDPSCHAAAATLLQLHAQQTLPVSVLTAGCCFYLEGQPPTWLPPLLELRGKACFPAAWSVTFSCSALVA